MSMFNRKTFLDGGLSSLKTHGISIDPVSVATFGLAGDQGLFNGGLLEGGTQTTTTNNEFNSTIKPFAEDAFQQLSQTSVPTYFPGTTLAPQSANTLAGIKGLTTAAPQQQAIANTAAGGFNFTLNDMLNPETNVALQRYMEGAIAPIFDRLENQTIPGIGGQAVQAGQFGGPNQNNLVLDALTDATRNAGDITSAIASNAYTTSLDNFTNTLLNADRIQSNQAQPAQTLLAAGGIQEDRHQDVINDEVDRHNFGQTAEFDFLTNYINTLLSAPQNQTSVTQGADTNPIQAAASLAPYLFLL